MMQMIKKYFPLSITIFLLAGCAADLFGSKIPPEGSLEEAQQKLVIDPKDKSARVEAVNALYKRINQLMSDGDSARKNGNFDQARDLYIEVLKLDASYPRATVELRRLDLVEKHSQVNSEVEMLIDAGKLETARTKLRPVLIEDPSNIAARALMQQIEDKTYKDLITPRTLKPPKSSTVSLEFRDADLRSIFDVISRTSGINFALDPTIREDIKTSIFVKDASVEEAIDFLLLMNQLSKKVLTDNSLLIYPQNRSSQYEDITLRTYYLNHADAKQMAAFIKSSLPIKDVYVDEKLNMVSLKAPFEQLKNVERLIADSDFPEPEVIMDVEILEIKRSRLTDIGISYPDTFSLLGGSGPNGELTWFDLRNIDSSMVSVSPVPIIRALRNDGDANLLANPRIRVKNREKAKIHIGDKVPVLTTTVGAGNSSFASTSANYIDVGLKLDVEPKIMLNNDVSIRVNLEVSSVTDYIEGPNKEQFPQIGTRNTSTILMTGNNETQVLAGLISDEDRKNSKKVPLLGSIPILGRLFSTERDDRTKTELVLLITPHVVRNILRPDSSNAEFYAGTGSARGPININPAAFLQQLTGVPPAQSSAPASAPAAPAAAESNNQEIPEGAPRPLARPFGQ